jgi:hypothetical protein
MRFRKRLERLERMVPDRTCPACRHQRGNPLITIKQIDGTIEEVRPAPCPLCRQGTEHVIEIEVVPMRKVSPPQETTVPQGNEKGPWKGARFE